MEIHKLCKKDECKIYCESRFGFNYIQLSTFDDKNIVKTLSNYDIKNVNKIKFNNNKSAVTETKKGFFSDLFGNIGQVRAQ